jgi:hypothetical protein
VNGYAAPPGEKGIGSVNARMNKIVTLPVGAAIAIREPGIAGIVGRIE